MSLINSTAIPSGASAYEIKQSLRFNDNDSAHLNKTFASAGNRKTWTFSTWVKRGNLTGTELYVLTCGTGNSGWTEFIRFNGDNTLTFSLAKSNASNGRLATNQVFRDTSAWYHIVCVHDSSNSTSGDRIRLYVNGSRVTDLSTETMPSVNDDSLFINNAGTHGLGEFVYNSSGYFDGYLGEVNFIDGQALTSADFGEFGDYGEWKPIEYSGSYGTNGFYLPFKQDYTVEGFSTVLYRGTGATQYIGGTGFSPDLVWVKRRDSSAWHVLSDSVRGTGKSLYSNDSAAEGDDGSVTLAAFNTDGFTIGSSGAMNTSGASMVGWNWDMGGSNATNTAGSIQSTVRANPSYGQSIVSYTGTGANATIGHGLSSAPEMVIVKNRSSTSEWITYHASLGNTKFLALDTTSAVEDAIEAWNDTTPTSSLFTVGTSNSINNDSMIAYCFHSVTGYSKFGSFTGNGSADGPEVTLGFAPAFVLIKSSSQTDDWTIYDNTRQPSFQSARGIIYANKTDAEDVSNSTWFTLGSNSFKWNRTGGGFNVSGQTYIYMAFADKREYAYWLDQSGNNNDWTSNNLTESDVMVDSPTNNFATMNPLANSDVLEAGTCALSEGNLQTKWTNTGGTVVSGKTYSTLFPTTGKWYWEFNVKTLAESTRGYVGVGEFEEMDLYGDGQNDKSYQLCVGTVRRLQAYGNEFDNTFSAAAAGDIWSFAVDWTGTSSKFWMRKNGGSWEGGGNPATNSTPTKTYSKTDPNSSMCPYHGVGSGSPTNVSTIIHNFGQDSSFAGNKTSQGNQDGNNIGDFYYTPPTGFLALCTSNLPDVAVVPSEHFNAVLYTGNATNRNITDVGFAPDFTWLKAISIGYGHRLIDTVRGAPNVLASQSTSAENTSETTGLTAFRTDGFTLGTSDGLNKNGETFVAWNWKANGSGSSNTEGSINTTKTSANVDAGFSIITYTGNATSGATIGHGLSKPPEFWTIKERGGGGDDWNCYHKGLASAPETKWIRLNSTAAIQDASNMWNDQAPTSSVIYLGNSGEVNGGSGETFVCYAFHSVDGYSKVGSYTGNTNADGAFVHTSFAPALVLIKRSDSTGHWKMYTAAISPENLVNDYFNANETDQLGSPATANSLDFLSNGFKVRSDYGDTNTGTLVYIAFASVPFKFGNGR